jgi:putative transposase
MARKTFKFRLYPNRQQRDKLTATLDVCRELYNAGLEERIGAWKNRTPVWCNEQINQLPDIKETRPDVAGVFSQVLQDTLRRLNKTYKAFFGRVKRGQKSRVPSIQGTQSLQQFHLSTKRIQVRQQTGTVENRQPQNQAAPRHPRQNQDLDYSP